MSPPLYGGGDINRQMAIQYQMQSCGNVEEQTRCESNDPRHGFFITINGDTGSCFNSTRGPTGFFSATHGLLVSQLYQYYQGSTKSKSTPCTPEADLSLLYNNKNPPSFHSGRWKSGTNPDLSFTTTNRDSAVPSPIRPVIGKFPRSQHRPSIIIHPTLIPSTQMELSKGKLGCFHTRL